MLVAIDASRSVDAISKTGVEIVSDNLIKNLISQIKARPEFKKNIKFIFMTPKKISWLEKIGVPVFSQKLSQLVKYENKQIIQYVFGKSRLWTVLSLSLKILLLRPDILFIPVHVLPFFCPRKTYKIIHDAAFLHRPQDYSFLGRLYLKFDLWRCRHYCSQVIVPTPKVKQDLIQLGHFNPNRVEVIPWGYSPKNKTSNTDAKPRQSQILYIGRLESKKNISTLIKSFVIFNQKYPEYKLILAGKPCKGFNSDKYQSDNIKFLGYISEQKKHQLLSQSTALVLVSHQEGFGFPVLEGFDFNIPVLASDIKTLRFVGQSACLYTDISNPKEIARNMETICNDLKLRQQLIQAGKQRLKSFSWGKTTASIIKLFTLKQFINQTSPIDHD